ncbi:MAG: hypothetical protein V7L05_29615 [Nostoc sp.]|uniref:hypothetical protein n=1 Tax=Nostoc sp. TaxID=1180 RepID=UPI002FFBF0FA
MAIQTKRAFAGYETLDFLLAAVGLSPPHEVCLAKLLLYSASRILRRGRPQDRNAALNPRYKT